MHGNLRFEMLRAAAADSKGTRCPLQKSDGTDEQAATLHWATCPVEACKLPRIPTTISILRESFLKVGAMQIFVSGTWREAKAEPYRTQATILGRMVAQEGFDLSCGPGTGIARHVIDGYRAEAARGVVRYYLPSRELMSAVGEDVHDGADEIVQTEFDYPMRNVWQVKQCVGLFVITGGDGTLEEVLPALIDYRIPVAMLEGSGSAATAVHLLCDIYRSGVSLLLFGIGRPFIGARVARADPATSALRELIELVQQGPTVPSN